MTLAAIRHLYANIQSSIALHADQLSKMDYIWQQDKEWLVLLPQLNMDNQIP